MLVPNTTQTPNLLFDVLLTELADSELRVLLYIIRRTFGFQKRIDRISFSQFENGIKSTTGAVLDKGCGITRKYISEALTSLVDCGVVIKHEDAKGNSYELNLEMNLTEVVAKRNQFRNETKIGSERKPKSVAKGNLQKKGNQGNKDIAVVRPQTFFLKDEIKKLEDAPQRHLNIIALFIEKRYQSLKGKILDKEQYKVFLSQHLRPASTLKVYTDEQLVDALESVAKQCKDIDWNLHTVIKHLTK